MRRFVDMAVTMLKTNGAYRSLQFTVPPPEVDETLRELTRTGEVITLERVRVEDGTWIMAKGKFYRDGAHVRFNGAVVRQLKGVA